MAKTMNTLWCLLLAILCSFDATRAHSAAGRNEPASASVRVSVTGDGDGDSDGWGAATDAAQAYSTTVTCAQYAEAMGGADTACQGYYGKILTQNPGSVFCEGVECMSTCCVDMPTIYCMEWAANGNNCSSSSNLTYSSSQQYMACFESGDGPNSCVNTCCVPIPVNPALPNSTCGQFAAGVWPNTGAACGANYTINPLVTSGTPCGSATASCLQVCCIQNTPPPPPPPPVVTSIPCTQWAYSGTQNGTCGVAGYAFVGANNKCKSDGSDCFSKCCAQTYTCSQWVTKSPGQCGAGFIPNSVNLNATCVDMSPADASYPTCFATCCVASMSCAGWAAASGGKNQACGDTGLQYVGPDGLQCGDSGSCLQACCAETWQYCATWADSRGGQAFACPMGYVYSAGIGAMCSSTGSDCVDNCCTPDLPMQRRRR